MPQQESDTVHGDKGDWAGSPLGKKVSTVSASLSSNRQIILCSNDSNELNHGSVMNCSLLGLRDKSYFILHPSATDIHIQACRDQQPEGAELNMTGVLVSCCAVCFFQGAAPIPSHEGCGAWAARLDLLPSYGAELLPV